MTTYASTTLAIPDGWTLVPLEPTKEMLLATRHISMGRSVAEADTAIYKAMIAAAPMPNSLSESEKR